MSSDQGPIPHHQVGRTERPIGDPARMEGLIYLIPIALFLGLLGLAAFLWAMRSGQYEELDGAAERILFVDEDPPTPSSP